MNRPKKSYGQHFLVNAGAADRIVAAAEAGPGSRVLEIGPGRGVLTGRLLATGASVTAIEADPELEPVLRSQFPALDLRMADAVRYDFAALGDGPFTLVSNLPYNVSKPLLMRFYAERRRFPRWVLMMQKEVAERVLARPGSKDWGPLGILLHNVCAVERVADLGPNSFRPPPKVDSTVLKFDVRPAPLEDMGGDEVRFADKLFQLFQERRKTVRNRFKALGLPPDATLAKFGLVGNERVETFDLATLARIVRALL